MLRIATPILFLLTATLASTEKPNFVIIFADDLGYGDLGCYGAEKIKTPRLDQMAKEGMRFTSFYCSAPLCTSSRAGMLTGRLHVRSGMNNVLFPFSKGGLPQEEITIAELLKQENYATACIGKWHLGWQEEHLPMNHGFDYYYGIPYSNDMDVVDRKDPPIPILRNTEIIEQPADQHTLTKRYTEEAVKFITEHKDEPFFVYLPHSMPHVPIFASSNFEGKSAGGLYGDVIEEIDWSTGQILEALHDLGLAENTLVFFTSDNGPWLVKEDHAGSSGPLREGKGTCFEGGQREPAIAWWPGKIAPGSEEHGIASTLDFLPTLCALAGVEAPKDRALDGYDLTPTLLEKSPRENQEFHYYLANRYMAYRDGKWKLKRPMKLSVYGKRIEHEMLLFDLEADPGEQNNLAETHPEIVERMEKAMTDFEESLGNLPRSVN